MKYPFSIVKFKNSIESDLPKSIADKYFYKYNVLGISYETSGSYDYLNDDLYTIYFCINSNTLIDYINDFINQSLYDINIITIGTDNIIPGENYFINQALSDKLHNIDESIVVDDSYLYNRNNDIDKYFIKPDYYELKNYVKDLVFSEEYLQSFYSNFCKIILEYSEITPTELVSNINQIYNKVLDYYQKFQMDNAIISMNMILNSNYSTISNTSSCGCGSNSLSNEQYCSTSCLDLYRNSMFTYLKQMLSDSNFYIDWMFIEEAEDEVIPNIALIDTLVLFIESFKELQYDLSAKTKGITCDCPKLTDTSSDCNYKIIDNYLKVLNWVKNNEIEQNINKIKIYGQQFAELLPNLQF